MSARATDERGFSLIEVMIVCALFLVVTGATLTALTSFTTSHRRVEIQHDHAEDARLGLDVAARQLRNLANPTVTSTTTISRAADYDFIFQTSDPAKTWVRYCLQTTAPATPNQGRLWEVQSPTAALPAGMDGPCPGTGAGTVKQVVSARITNAKNGVDRNIFDYECATGQPATCPSAAAEYPRITNVGIELFVDSNVSDNIRELRVSTGVFLRNQNEPPEAVATVNGTAPRTVIFNGSRSTDAESRTLQYYWFKGTAPTTANFTDCNATPTGALDDQGVTLTYPFPASDATGSTQNFWLAVRDPGCLTDISAQIQVVVPA